MRLIRPFPARRSAFGDAIIVVFLISQALDGILTYLGVTQYGVSAEGNPLISSAIPVLGQGLTLATAKILAACLGVLLHVTGVHRVVAVLTGLYLAAAVVPWATLLLLR